MTPDEVRQYVADNLPVYLEMLDEIIRSPGRNSVAQLGGIKLALGLVVPTVTATTISSPAGGPVEVTLRLIKVKHEETEGGA